MPTSGPSFTQFAAYVHDTPNATAPHPPLQLIRILGTVVISKRQHPSGKNHSLRSTFTYT